MAYRRPLSDGGLAGLCRTHLYAGSVGSGAWVVSIIAILAIAHFRKDVLSTATMQFQVVVTYLIAFSLILTGPLQLLFARLRFGLRSSEAAGGRRSQSIRRADSNAVIAAGVGVNLAADPAGFDRRARVARGGLRHDLRDLAGHRFV